MHIPRIYYPQELKLGEEIILKNHYISNVLRMTPGCKIQLFNGKNILFNAEIMHLDRTQVRIKITNIKEKNCESPLYLHLGQVILRGEKMKFSIQKAVELGINVITPLFSERCGVKLTSVEMIKKKQHWKNIAIAACEQCGRNSIPNIRDIMTLQSWSEESSDSFKINFYPYNNTTRITMLPCKIKRFRLLIGPEGGISRKEMNMVIRSGFINVCMGPRILRTETATIATIAALQIYFGDLG
ncbi:MAG: 16S rRNA (uracil(1498)-N(3))-methyltransferase [Candidatus Dasytiphilus stammeri]